MGWSKGKRRKVIPGYISNREKKRINLSDFDMPPDWSRSRHLAAQQEALQDFVESGEYLEAEAGLRARAVSSYRGMLEAVKKYREGSQRANVLRSRVTEERRKWLVINCSNHIFLSSRKQAIALMQAELSSAKLQSSSVSRLYADIAAIRKGWGIKYLSQAKDASKS